jgi:hypothetical protein
MISLNLYWAVVYLSLMISLNLYWAVVYFYEEPSVLDLKSKLKMS